MAYVLRRRVSISVDISCNGRNKMGLFGIVWSILSVMFNISLHMILPVLLMENTSVLLLLGVLCGLCCDLWVIDGGDGCDIACVLYSRGVYALGKMSSMICEDDGKMACVCEDNIGSKRVERVIHRVWLASGC